MHLQAGQCGNQIGAKVGAVARGRWDVFWGGNGEEGTPPGPAASDAIFSGSSGR